VDTNTTQLLVANTLSNSQLANISFYSGGTTNSGFLGTGVFSGSQIIPVPEASVVISALLLLGWLMGACSLPINRIVPDQCCFNRRSDSGRSLD